MSEATQTTPAKLQVQAGRTYQDGYGRQVDIHEKIDLAGIIYCMRGKIVLGPNGTPQKDVNQEVSYCEDGSFFEDRRECKMNLVAEVAQITAEESAAIQRKGPHAMFDEEPAQDVVDKHQEELDRGLLRAAGMTPTEAPTETSYLRQVPPPEAQPALDARKKLKAFIYALIGEGVSAEVLQSAAAEVLSEGEDDNYTSKAFASAAEILAAEILEEKS